MADTSDHSGIDWVQLKKDMDKVATTETGGQRIIRKCKENPFVPIGTIATVGALSYGLICFKRGEKVMQQKMMRLRILAQLFTVTAAVGGVFMALPKDKRTIQDLIKSGERNLAKPE